MSKAVFNYETAGLPDDPAYRAAVAQCHDWLLENMSVFGPERIASFMHNQPINAARLLLEKTESPSRESVILALLGPAKFDLIAAPDGKGVDLALEAASRIRYGNRTVDLLLHMAGEAKAPQDAELVRDANRLFMVEGLSTMNDQLIGRKRIDPHHAVRWTILQNLEKNFTDLRGQNPGLDPIFIQALAELRAALEALDAAAAAKGKPPRGPKPEGK